MNKPTRFLRELIRTMRQLCKTDLRYQYLCASLTLNIIMYTIGAFGVNVDHTLLSIIGR